MSVENKIKQEQGGSAHKRHYLSPTLVLYGQVRDLTQSGTGNITENTRKNGSCQSNSKRRPCLSDQRAKGNLVHIGAHSLGIGLYLFDYKPEFRDAWGHGRQFGVMAQEAETFMPEAVSMHPDGYKMVDYAMLGITRSIQ
jgi:hypothetical protein